MSVENNESIRSSKQTAYSLVSAFREFMGFWSPRVIMTAAGLSWTARMIAGGWTWWDLLIPALILLAWPVQEWLIHVFILHMKPRELGPMRFDPLASRKHRSHHEDPWNLIDVFVPLPVVLTMLPLIALFWWAVTPTTELFLTGFAAYSSMALVYEWTHYLIHSRYRPKSAMYKHLWTHHRLHHCKNENYWFGVTMTSGDAIFGTAPDKEEVETSKTCRNLHGEDASV